MNRLWLMIPLLLFAGTVFSEEEYQDPGVYESSHSQTAEAPFPMIAGENLDLRTGSSYWEIPGPAIPGQGGLDVRVNFSFNKSNESGYYNLGSWDLEIPRIEIAARTHVYGHTRGSYNNRNKACEDPYTKGSDFFGVPDGKRSPISLIMPGLAPQVVLERDASANIYPPSVKYVTTQNYIISCSDNGATFKVVSPEAITYEFNVLSSTTGFFGWRDYPAFLTIYPSKIYDLWGNKLTFSYYDSHEVMEARAFHTRKVIDKIQSNDGRLIDFTHSSEANPKLEKITAGDRTWKFKYEGATTASKYLEGIVLPDGSKWEVKYDKHARGDWNDSSIGVLPDKVNSTSSSKKKYAIKEIKTPTGAKLNYTYIGIDKKYWGLKACCADTPAVKTRTLSGSDILSHTSTFNYSQQQNKTISRTEIESGGRKDTFDFHRNVWQHGLLESHTVYENGTRVLKKGYEWGRGGRIGRTYLENEHESGQSLRWVKNIETLISGKTLKVTYSGHDKLGNPRKISENGTRARVTNFSYHNDTSNWFVGRVKSISVDGVSDVTSYTYEKNKVKTVTDNKLTQTFYYHSNGNVKETRRTVGGILEREYYSDYYRGIPRKVTDADDHITVTKVDYFGNTKRIDDPEDNWVEYEYDSIGRVSRERRPGRADIIISWPSTTQKNTSQGNYRNIEKYNALGQAKYSKSWDTAYSSEPVIVNKQYTNRGGLHFTSWPSDVEGEAKGVKQYYDVLDRLVKTTNTTTGKSKTICYGAACIQSGEPSIGYGIRTVNEKGVKTILDFEVYGSPSETYLKNLYRQKSLGVNSFVKTSHSRNTKGQLVSVAQGGITESYTLKPGTRYVEKITRPELTINNALNEKGQVVERWFNNDRSQLARFKYTKAGRLESIDYPAATYDVLFDYYKNGAMKRARRVNSANNPTHNLSDWNYSYYQDGSLKSENLSVGGDTFGLVYSYTPQGNVNTITYPSGEKINHSTDGMGRDRALYSDYPSKADRYLVNSVAYHPNNSIERINFTNGLSQSYGIDSQKRIDSVSVPGKVNLKYGFDYLNNIESITDYMEGGRKDHFSYDGLNRLDTANGRWGSYKYTYSDSGNILNRYKAGSSTLSYKYDSKNLLRSVSGPFASSYNYDSQGNVIYNSKNHFIYDFAGNALGMGETSKADDWVYEYDAHNKRVINYAGRGEYVSMYNRDGKLMAEMDTNGNISEYYYLNGELITRRDNCVSFSDAQGNCRTKVEWILPAITMMLN
ncbi:RHS repeat domain-containing protein [Microbulbifer sp. DLAB2-AA]|uniref:RHS repeat domain-containing protein n=1 Tax=Microbulbifer sp. DLAB2-AA TaxID=3243394 RepID=UPI0040394F5B